LFARFKHGLNIYPWGSKETMVIILLVQILIALQLEDYDLKFDFFFVFCFLIKHDFHVLVLVKSAILGTFKKQQTLFRMKISQCKV